MQNEHGVFYPQHDALGSVTMLTDKDGKLAERYSYSVTGEVSVYDANGTQLAASAFGNRWMYSGREWLPEVGLYDYRNRVYSAELGRFLQTDPVKFHAGDLNLHRYVGNDFLNLTDPGGLAAGGIFVKVTLAFWTAKSYSIGIYWDGQGDYEVLVGEDIGINAGTPGISASFNYLLTNADSVQQLKGYGYAVGFSVATPNTFYFEKDWVKGPGYMGTSGGLGVGTPGGSVNYAETKLMTTEQAWGTSVFGSGIPSLQYSNNYSPSYGYGE